MRMRACKSHSGNSVTINLSSTCEHANAVCGMCCLKNDTEKFIQLHALFSIDLLQGIHPPSPFPPLPFALLQLLYGN